MGTSQATKLRIGGALVLANFTFLISFLRVYSEVLLILILMSLVALTVYHAYKSGSLITTTLIPILVAGGLMVGVGVDEMGGCPPVPGCRLTPASVYLHWTLSAIILGIGSYLVGDFARTRPSFSP